jgi:hypothetical protein
LEDFLSQVRQVRRDRDSIERLIGRLKPRIAAALSPRFWEEITQAEAII